jgi:hypothetical protein
MRSGHGCPKCAGKGSRDFRLSEFVRQDDSGYSYPDLARDFVNATTLVDVSCPTHGTFKMRPADLLWDHRCPSCGTARSKGELGVESFIKSLGVRVVSSDRTVLGGRRELDIYCPDQKVAIEFNGAYMHSVSKGKNAKYHQAKFNDCADKGIHLITVWDFQWRDNTSVIKSILRHKLGRSSQRIGARSCDVVLVSEIDRKRCLNAWHLQGAPHFRDTTVGLVARNTGELVAVMSFGRVRFGQGVELTRFATKPNMVVSGGFSKLLNAGLDKGETCVSFVDHCVASGVAYTKVGFAQVGRVAPAYRWTKGRVVLTRYSTMRKHLPKLLGGAFDPALSERDNMLTCGWVQFYDCGKTKLSFTRN